MASAASSSDQSGEAYTMSGVRCDDTVSTSGSAPSAMATSTSRSVRMPAPWPSGSTTTAAPTLRERIATLTSRSV